MVKSLRYPVHDSHSTPHTVQARSYPVAGVRETLIASTSSGTFIDTAYYLFSRRTNGGGVGHPRAVYANSRAMRATADHFDAQLSGRFSMDNNIPAETKDYSYESDSDLEDADDVEPLAEVVIDKGKAVDDDKHGCSSSASNEERGLTAAQQGVKHTLFIPDVAAVTWQALVCSVYTGEVSFAPLRSNGLEARHAAQEQHRGAYPDRPALCSPKSMYRLADMVGIEELKLLAQRQIEQQLSLKGITKELFSHFSATYPEVLSAQISFIYDHGHMSQVLHEVQVQLAYVVSGQLPHAETVLSALLTTLSGLLVAHPGQPAPPLGTLAGPPTATELCAQSTSAAESSHWEDPAGMMYGLSP